MISQAARELWDMKLEDFCQYGPPWYTNVIIAVLLVMLLIAFTAVVFVVKREIIVIWVYSKPWGRHFFSEDIIDKDKPYDAFLSYAQADSDFVEKELLKGERKVLHLSFTNIMFHQAWRALRT